MLITKALAATGVTISAVATGLALNHVSEADESVHSPRAWMTESKARDALLTLDDLPQAWTTGSAPEDYETLGDIGLHPKTCAHAAVSSERTSGTWDDAPINVRTDFVTSNGDTRLEQTITHDPDLDPGNLVDDLNDLIVACLTYTLAAGDGIKYAGTITAENLGQGDNGIGLVQTWTSSSGTITAYFAYVIDGRTITTLNATTNGALDAEAFEAIVAEASDNL
ncbi:hypothetical protein ACIO3S_24475 [Nocardioides sp. NPDC087217]|uniref:hypothetical protein n=1 Tax=Nocardioides sp. NPDC087217 TaxID=3364335 RepID=UPI00382BA8D3